MQYALLFYHPPASEIPEAERAGIILTMLDEMRAWQAELEAAGVFRTTLGLTTSPPEHTFLAAHLAALEGDLA